MDTFASLYCAAASWACAAASPRADIISRFLDAIKASRTRSVYVFFHFTLPRMDQEKCLELIELYKNVKYLWDSKEKDYHNVNKREDTWKKFGIILNVPVHELKAKMKSLLGTYRREKSRVKKSHITGTGEYIIKYEYINDSEVQIIITAWFKNSFFLSTYIRIVIISIFHVHKYIHFIKI